MFWILRFLGVSRSCDLDYGGSGIFGDCVVSIARPTSILPSVALSIEV
jgi:hypothetical protein